MTPVLAARNPQRLQALADELGGLETQTADVGDPASVRALVERGRRARAARSGRSCAGASRRWRRRSAPGAHYLDSTGEGTFIRRVFEQYGPRAERAGVGLLTAMGYDWVPGQPRGRAGAARGGAGGAPRRAGVLQHAARRRRRRHERRHARERRRHGDRAGLHVRRRAHRQRARRQAPAELRGLPRAQRARRCRSGRASSSRCRGCARSCSRSTPTSAGSGPASRPLQAFSAAGAVADDGAGRQGRDAGARRPARPRLDRRPGRRGAGAQPGAGPGARRSTPAGGELTSVRLEGPTATTSRRTSSPGAPRPRSRAACRASARSARSTGSGSTRSRPRRPRATGSRRGAEAARPQRWR